MTKLPTLERIQKINPGFFHETFTNLLKDEKYEIFEEGGKVYLAIDTRFTRPLYEVDPDTLDISYCHDRGDA